MSKTKFFLSVFVVFIAGVVYLIGIFDAPTEPEVVHLNERLFAYRAFKGSFQGISNAFSEVMEAFDANGLLSKNRTAVGVFFDSPEETSAEQLRWWIGFELSAAEADVIAKHPNSEPPFLLNILRIPAARGVHTTFAMKFILSPMLGAMRAYPALKSYISSRPELSWNCPPVEFYEPNHVIRYVVLQENCESMSWDEKQLLIYR